MIPASYARMASRMTDVMADRLPDDMTATPPTSDVGVTPAEAAAFLGISERTVQRRLKQGDLRGYKVNTGRGEVWRVMLDGMVVTPTKQGDVMATIAAKADVTPPAVAEFAHAVIDELRQEYREEITRLQQQNQQLAGQLGFTQAKLQDAEATIQRLLMAPKDEPDEEQPAPAEQPVQQRSWWKRLFR